MVTHDEEMTTNADRLLHMRDGKIERSHTRAALTSCDCLIDFKTAAYFLFYFK